jgi:WXG100 family type VII secretion target
LADQTQAEAAVMAQTAEKFRNTNQSLQDMLRRLMTELEGLRGSWAGQGAQAFDQARMRWQEDMVKLQRALDETADAISAAGRQYTASDEATAGRFKPAAGPSVQLPL